MTRAERLSSNPQIQARLTADPDLDARLRAGDAAEVCALSLGLEDVETWAAEQLEPRELLRAIVAMRRSATAVLRAAPALVSTVSPTLLQAIYLEPISGEQIVDAAIATGLELVEAVGVVADPALSRSPLRPGVGIALGRAFVGMSESGESLELVAVGRPVALSRRLAEERDRLGAAVLIDDAAGRSGSLVRPLDVYRLSGAAALQRLFAPAADVTAETVFTDVYQRGLELFYVDRAATAAAEAFNECLELAPEDRAALAMLERCRAASGPPRPRAYRVRA